MKTQRKIAWQSKPKVAEFKKPTKSLSEELEVLAKAKAVISEKTGDAAYRDNRSVVSSRGGLAGELIKSEYSIELAQLTSHADASAMHAEKGEAQESESDDIVMVIDGETFCVSEEDMPKVYYEGDDGQVLPTEQVHEGKKIHSNGDNSSVKVKGLISDVITKLEEKASVDATHKATSNVCTAQRLSGMLSTTRRME